MSAAAVRPLPNPEPSIIHLTPDRPLLRLPTGNSIVFAAIYGVLRRISPNFQFVDGVEIRIKKQVEEIEVWTPIEQINQTIRNYFRRTFRRNFRQIVRKMFRRIF